MPAAESRVELANPEPTVELANLMPAAESRVELANPEPTLELANLMHAAESSVLEVANPEPRVRDVITRDRYFERCVPLHKAALLGKWEDAERLIRADPSLVNSAITEGGETALHLAAAEGHVQFVANLMGVMEKSDLGIQNKKGKTALCFAAVAGHVNIAEIMLRKDQNLIFSEGYTPLYYAAWQGCKEMAHFLFKISISQSRTPQENQTEAEESVSQSRSPQVDHSETDQYVFQSRAPQIGQTEVDRSVSQSRAPQVDRAETDQSVSHSRAPQENQTQADESVSQSRALQIDQTEADQSVSQSLAPQENRTEAEESFSQSRAPQVDQTEANQSSFQSWPKKNRIKCLMRCIHSGLYDLALKIVETDETLAVAEDEGGETPLLALARKPLTFYGTQRFGDNIANTILSCLNMGVRDSSSTPSDAYKLFDCLWHNLRSQEDVETAQLPSHISHLLFTAVESKNDDFMIELINRYPDFIYKNNQSQHTIFHIAVSHRSVEVFNLMFEIQGIKNLMLSFIDNKDNNILHLAAILPPKNQLSTIPGAALQMQREVLWYKEVEKIVPPFYKTKKNEADLTPYELFLKEHSNLMAEGEKQMKQIAKSCMLVTTLITTIVFTTSFTVPGDYNDKGVPNLRHEKFFMLLPFSEATTVLASLISMLMLLSVLTSNYSFIDFQRWLPIWLVIGVVMLFFSIGAMMVAFFTCLFFYGLGHSAVIVLLVLVAIVPIIFLIPYLPLLITIIRCTYSSRWLFKSNKRLFL